MAEKEHASLCIPAYLDRPYAPHISSSTPLCFCTYLIRSTTPGGWRWMSYKATGQYSVKAGCRGERAHNNASIWVPEAYSRARGPLRGALVVTCNIAIDRDARLSRGLCPYSVREGHIANNHGSFWNNKLRSPFQTPHRRKKRGPAVFSSSPFFLHPAAPI